MDNWKNAFLSAPYLAIDTETTGLDPLENKLISIQIGTDSDVWVINPDVVPIDDILYVVDKDCPLVFHNAKFDIKFLEQRYGDAFKFWNRKIYDTQLLEKLIRNGREGKNKASLKELALRYCNMVLNKEVREQFSAMTSFNDMNEEATNYAKDDVIATYRVFTRQVELIKKHNLVGVAAIECAAVVAIAHMELNGMPINVDDWRKLLIENDKELMKREMDLRKFLSTKCNNALEEQIPDKPIEYKKDGTPKARQPKKDPPLNLDSHPQLKEALRKFGINVEKTGEDEIKGIDHPLVKLILGYRECRKIQTTYGEKFLEKVRGGRVYAKFNQMGAVTGRMSSSDPNMQNIPAGSNFRKAFNVGPGRVLVTADYSAAELRIIAEASGDKVFVKAFNSGEDLHSIVATTVFLQKVSKTENKHLRDMAKTINFGLAYGMGPTGFARKIGMDIDEARGIIRDYFESFPAIKEYLERSADMGMNCGYVKSMSGRTLWLDDMIAEGREEWALRNVGKNMPIQGTNADMTKVALAKIDCAIKKQGVDAKLVNCVHDEIVVECAEELGEFIKDLVKKCMVSAGRMFIERVPVEVDIHVGREWVK